jgi:hypothetical protein
LWGDVTFDHLVHCIVKQTTFMQSKWITLIAATGLMFTLASCGREKWPCVDGTGPVISETRSVSGFTGISNEMEAIVYVSQGPEYSVRIDAQSNLMNEIRTALAGSTLEIYSEHCIDGGEPVIVYVTMPNISSIDVSGSGSVFTETPISTSSLNVDVSGSGSFNAVDSIVAGVIDLDISGSGTMNIFAITATLSADISGSGSITLSGSGNTVNQEISGSGRMLTFGFLVTNAYVEVSGSGNIEVNATDLIDGDISGSGDIYYKNSPIINVDISGSGSLIHVP